MNNEYVTIIIDFYAGNFYSGKINIPHDLWNFNRKSTNDNYIYNSENAIYEYVKNILQPLYPRYKITLIKLQKTI